MEQSKRGGKRSGAGRKPVDNPKEQVTLYVPKKSIWPFGNKEKLKDALYGFIDGKLIQHPANMQIQDLTKPTNEIKPFEQPATNYVAQVPKAPVVPITTKYEAFKYRILQTTMLPELIEIMKEVKAELMTLKEKNQLETISKEHSKSMYND